MLPNGYVLIEDAIRCFLSKESVCIATRRHRMVICSVKEPSDAFCQKNVICIATRRHRMALALMYIAI